MNTNKSKNYSPSSHVLSETQIRSFHASGYLLVRDMFSQNEVELLSSWTDELANSPEIPGRQMMYFEHSLANPEQRILSRIENFCLFHEGFERFVAEPRMQGCVSQLFDQPSVLFKDKINFKMPGGDGFKTHQDVQAGWDRYAGLHITALVSIDECTAENGCLEIAGGYHQHGLIGDKWEPMREEQVQGMDFRLCPTKPGDVIFFDSFTPHRSAPNQTDRARRVLYITYNRLSEGDSRAQYYADKRKSYPPDCERDLNKNYRFRV